MNETRLRHKIAQIKKQYDDVIRLDKIQVFKSKAQGEDAFEHLFFARKPFDSTFGASILEQNAACVIMNEAIEDCREQIIARAKQLVNELEDSLK